MAIKCPKCGEGTLKKGEKMVYCSDYKPRKNGNEWVNEGSCDFRIMFRQKILKRSIKPEEIKKIVQGEAVQIDNATVSLDLNNPFYLRVEFGEKQEDPDL